MSVETNAANIEKGSKVRVTVEGLCESTTEAGRLVVKTGTGDSAVKVRINPSPGVTVEVLAPPLPPEPGAGQMVRAVWSNIIYRRDSVYGWYKINGTDQRKYLTWQELNDEWGIGSLFRLVTDMEVVNAHDLCKSALTVGRINTDSVNVTADEFGLVSIVDPDPWGGSVTHKFSRAHARQLALAILKATGGI